MHVRLALTESGPAPGHEVLHPAQHRLPAVLASPHSGSHYPAALLAASRLSMPQLSAGEDVAIDRLFAQAACLGAPLIRAHYARVWVDLNREPYELDPAMFRQPVPDFANCASPRVAAGLGTIARCAGAGAEIYVGLLDVEDALGRIESIHKPYHATLDRLVAETRARFGWCLLLDCHSMPAEGRPRQDGWPADFVLGDRHGEACAPSLVARARDYLGGLGYRVGLNTAYAGGFTTMRHGRPAAGRHALQIEVSRTLYLDGDRACGRFDRLAAEMAGLLAALAGGGAP